MLCVSMAFYKERLGTVDMQLDSGAGRVQLIRDEERAE